MPSRVDLYFDEQVARYKAIEVRTSGYNPNIQFKKLPLITEVPQHAVWFATENFGWIYSAVRSKGRGRKFLLKY